MVAAVVFVRFLGLSSLFKVRLCESVILALQSSRAGFTLVLTILMLFGMLVVCFDGCRRSEPFELVDDGDLLLA